MRRAASAVPQRRHRSVRQQGSLLRRRYPEPDHRLPGAGGGSGHRGRRATAQHGWSFVGRARRPRRGLRAGRDGPDPGPAGRLAGGTDDGDAPMLLRAGLAMMALAVALTGVIVAIVLTEEPARSAAVKSAQQGPTEPLKRADPGVEPWKEETLSQPPHEKTEPEAPERKPDPESEPEQNPEPQPPEVQPPEVQPPEVQPPEVQPPEAPEPASEPDVEGEPPEPT